MDLTQCTLCPRNCRVDRTKSVGFCGAPASPMIAKAMLHRWEEPCICYGNGSGAVFFSGCQLRCVFCQNHTISSELCGRNLDTEKLSDLFIELEEKGACNINLISPTPYLDAIIPAIMKAKARGLSIPIVFNSGGYESVESLKKLDGLVDIYLPDFKFFSPELSMRYAQARDYKDRTLEAVLEMVRQTSLPSFDSEHLRRGTIVRHLVLPGSSADSINILELLSAHLKPDSIILSLMRQYTPMYRSDEYPELTRKITSLEYNKVVKAAQNLGFTDIYTQDSQSVGTEYVPDFSVFFDETN